MTQVDFIVEGKPVPKGRPRHATHNGRTWEYTPKTTLDYERKVREAFLEQNQSVHKDACIGIRIIFYMPIPKGTSKKQVQKMSGDMHRKKPDLDNLIKSVLDGLNGVAYTDDSLLGKVEASKVYCPPHIEPYAYITLTYED